MCRSNKKKAFLLVESHPMLKHQGITYSLVGELQ